MKTLFTSLSVIVSISTFAAILLWQAHPLSSEQTSTKGAPGHKPTLEKRPLAKSDQSINHTQASYQHVDDRVGKSELEPLNEPLPVELSEAETEALTMEKKFREQEEDQRFNVRLSAYYEELENQHLLQPVDSGWASAKQEQIISSIEDQPLMDNVDFAGIECRSNSCIMDFEISPSENESATSSLTLFDWLLENTGNCEIHGEAAVAASEAEELATQRIHLVNCV